MKKLITTFIISVLCALTLFAQAPEKFTYQAVVRNASNVLVANAPVSLTAWEGDRLVGVCFGITDFAYWLFITDLGVDRDYVKRGIGKKLMQAALEAADQLG